MTGFEHTVTFDLQGTKMVIPYGYLARYTQNNAAKWLSDTPGQDAYSTNLIEISVYYKKTNQGWVLEPYNRQNKAHFIQFLRDGLDSVDDIVIRKDACSLSTTMGERLLTYGVKKMPSAYPEYEAYEDKRHITENPYFHEFYYEEFIQLPLFLCVLSGILYHGYIYVLRFLIRGKWSILYYSFHIVLPSIVFSFLLTLLLYRFFFSASKKLEENVL